MRNSQAAEAQKFKLHLGHEVVYRALYMKSVIFFLLPQRIHLVKSRLVGPRNGR